MYETCGDNRFEIIQKAKDDLLEATNIADCQVDMEYIDSFLFRAWQMGWLDKYEPDYKERMKAEYDELKERTEKLNAFFGTDLFASLTDEKKQLMQEQHVAMVKYLDTLGRRCQLEGI